MQVQTVDSVFIRAARRDIHPVVVHLGGWNRWWPGLDLRDQSPSAVSVTLRAPGIARRRRRWTLEVARVRPDLGIDFRYSGDLAGEGEFYYLDEPAGTVVSYAFRGAVSDRAWRAAVRDHRAGVRVGLHALKDMFEGARGPGAEPGPALLAEQVRAAAAVAEGRPRQGSAA